MLFHPFDLRETDLPSERIEHQPWVYYTEESYINEVSWIRDFVTNDTKMAKFDMGATADMASHIPQTFEFKADFIDVVKAPLGNLTQKRSLKKKQSPIVWIATYASIVQLLYAFSYSKPA